MSSQILSFIGPFGAYTQTVKEVNSHVLKVKRKLTFAEGLLSAGHHVRGLQTSTDLFPRQLCQSGMAFFIPNVEIGAQRG